MMHAWLDIDRTFAELDALRRRWEHALDTNARRSSPSSYVGWSAWPEANLYDDGADLVVQADVPGLAPSEIDLRATQSGLTLSGERKVTAPEGYHAHRQERQAFKFSRSFAFPVKVDPERVRAEIKDGVLTVRLAKAKEVLPRRIAIAS